MKKIPTLFKRIYDGNRVKGVIDEVLAGMEWVLAGRGLPRSRSMGLAAQ